MNFVAVISIVWLIYSSTLFHTVVGVCCYSCGQYCQDCSIPTPYCGYQKCNILGCDCEACRSGFCFGFCVKDNSESEDDPLVVSKYRSLSHMNAQHIIHLADQNKDGWFNITEAKKWISRLRSDLSEAHIETEIIKLDRNKDGYLSHREIDEEDFD